MVFPSEDAPTHSHPQISPQLSPCLSGYSPVTAPTTKLLCRQAPWRSPNPFHLDTQNAMGHNFPAPQLPNPSTLVSLVNIPDTFGITNWKQLSLQPTRPDSHETQNFNFSHPAPNQHREYYDSYQTNTQTQTHSPSTQPRYSFQPSHVVEKNHQIVKKKKKKPNLSLSVKFKPRKEKQSSRRGMNVSVKFNDSKKVIAKPNSNPWVQTSFNKKQDKKIILNKSKYQPQHSNSSLYESSFWLRSKKYE